MTLKIFNALDKTDASPAEAGTPNPEIQQGMRFGVPPSGGGAHTSTMTLKIFNALDKTDASPAEAGTPNRLGQLEAEIQQGMKELEGMLK